MKTQIAKFIALLILLASVNLGFAASINTTKQTSGTKIFNVRSGQINCYQNVTDVCINNTSMQTISFSVPTINQFGYVYPQQWVDVYSNDYYASLFVTITNSAGQIIFNQYVSNHSIVNITQTASSKKLQVELKK